MATEGAEAEAEAAPRGRGRGRGTDHRCDNFIPYVAAAESTAADSEAIGPCLGLLGRWGCPARQKREPKPRKASELDRPRAKRTQRPVPDQRGSASQPGATVTKRRCLVEQPPPPPGLQRPHGCPSHAARAGTAAAVAIPHKLRTRKIAGEWPLTCARWPRGVWW